MLVGGGWTVRAEWLHVDLGDEDYHFKGKTCLDTPFDTDSFESELEFNVFRIGVNYSLNDEPAPLK